MTGKKIAYALNRIKNCKENGFLMEALLKGYHLNVELIKFILSESSSEYSVKDKKVKAIVNQFMKEISSNEALKSIINKKTLKIVKPWLRNMDLFFKAVKSKQPANTKSLQVETEKISGILNISIHKLFIKHK